MDIDRFKELPLMGIVRGIKEEELEPLLEAVIGAGLRTIEITMNTPDAASLISKAVEEPSVDVVGFEERLYRCKVAHKYSPYRGTY